MTDREQYTPGPASGRRGTKGRREVDARSRPRTAPPARKGLAGAHRPRASARMGSVRRRREPGCRGHRGKAHHGGGADAASIRDPREASRRSQGARIQLGRPGHPLGTEAAGGGTRLTLWHNIDRRFISMGAAGWHICFDVLDRLLAGPPIGRMVGPEAMKFGGWQRLNAEYAKQFGVEPPSWPPNARTLKHERKPWNRPTETALLAAKRTPKA